jgi:cytochrome c oxidase assembly protein subunit 15
MLPLAFFTYKKIITPKLRNRLLLLLGLGAAQGFIGWWMVSSGLDAQPIENRVRVKPYRLATHLLMATSIYAALIWQSFALLIKPPVVA